MVITYKILGLVSMLGTALVLIVEESPLLIRQGQPFKIAIKCQDDDGNDVLEGESKLKELVITCRHSVNK